MRVLCFAMDETDMKMEQKKQKNQKNKQKRPPEKSGREIGSFRKTALFLLGGFALYALITTLLVRSSNINRMVRATEVSSEEDLLAMQPALTGVMNVVSDMQDYAVNAQMISVDQVPGEEILAGMKSVNRSLTYQNAFSRYAQNAKELGYDARMVVTNNQLPYHEYHTLLQIVEAEATGGDEKSKLLIADVVLNRVEDERFPNSISEVVWQSVDGYPQFSPTVDGRMGNLTITDSTVRAVERALNGENIAQGALFFVARSSANGKNLKWFDDHLVYLDEYGGHSFYRYPTKSEEKESESEEQPVEASTEA